jgi:hypothetical protein
MAERQDSPLRTSARKESRRSTSNLLPGAVLITLLVGAFALLLQSLPSSAPKPPSKRDPRVGIVTLSPEGEQCRRMALDNKTGRMVEMERLPCTGAPPNGPQEIMQQRYSGGRLEAIRESFSSR